MGMIVCFCNQFNEQTVKEHLLSLDGKETTLMEAYRACAGGRQKGCGSCLRGALKEMVEEHNAQNAPQPA